MMSEASVTCEVTLDDYKAFVREVYKRARKRRSPRLTKGERAQSIILVALVFLMGGAMVFGLNDPEIKALPLRAWLIAAVPALLFLALYLHFLVRGLRQVLPAKNGIILGSHNYIVLPDAFVDETEYLYSRAGWPAFTEVVETRTYFFLILDRCGGYIVPKRAFPDGAAQQDFAERINAHIDS